jgi:hypothetical protein
MAENEYQGIGRIDRIEERETQSGKKYILTVVGGERYSCWRPDAIGGLGPGDFVSYRWRVNNGYKNIVSMKKADTPQEYKSFTKYRVLTEEQLQSMIRMSSLKSSSAIVARVLEGTVDERRDLALRLAADFEAYILGKRTNEDARDEPMKTESKRKKKIKEASAQTSVPVEAPTAQEAKGSDKDLPF